MRVLTLVSTFPPGYTGGAEISALNTCRGLMRAGVECVILVMNNRTTAQDEWYEVSGNPVHRVGLLTPVRTHLTDVFDWRVYRAVRRELRHFRPDLVHMHNASGSTLAPYVACRSLGVPVVNTLHDLWLLCPNNMLYRPDGSLCTLRRVGKVCQTCFRRYDFWGAIPHRRAVFAALTSNVKLFISPSQAVIDRHVEAGHAARRFRLVRLGFEEPRGAQTEEQMDWAPERGGPHKTIAYAGGGIEIKGAAVLGQALPAMLRHIEGLNVLIAGTGEEHFLAEFKKYAPAVRLLGRLSPEMTRSLFAAADLTVVPSICHENSPVVIYESYQVGTPVLGSAIGGIPELIDEQKTGYLFPVGDAATLASQAILHFGRPARERRRIRHQCIAAAHERLTFQRHVQGILDVYQEALSG